MSWKQLIQIIAAAFAVGLFVLMLSSCKHLPPAIVPAIHNSDTKDREVRVDTFWRDRVHIEYRNGDTVFVRDSFYIYVPKWRDKEVIVYKTDSVPYPVEVPVEVPAERTGWDKFCTRFFIGACIVLLLLLVWWLADYIPALKPIKAVIKGIKLFRS